MVPGFGPDYGPKPVVFGSTGESFDGKLTGALDEVQLFNRALSDAEIQAIFLTGNFGLCGPPVVNAGADQTVNLPVSTVSRKMAELEKSLGVRLLERSTRQLRMTEIGQGYFESCRRGLTEFEAWGDAKLPVEPAPMPAANLAFNPGGKPFPKASASFTSRFDCRSWTTVSTTTPPTSSWSS